jgi:hypothetical protein
MRPFREFADCAAVIDHALTSCGFSGTVGSKRWDGVRSSWKWVVRLSRDRRTRYAGEVRTRHTLGYRLRIDISIPVSVRLYIVTKSIASNGLMRWVYRWRRQEVVAGVPPALEGFVVVTANPDWARRLLADPDAVRILGGLMELRTAAGAASSVYFEADGLYYQSPRWQLPDITTEGIQRIVAELERLGRTAQALPVPDNPQRVSRLHAWTKANPAVAAIGLLGCFLGLSSGFFVFMVIGVATLAKLLG